VRLGAGGCAVAGVLFWLLTRADAQRREAGRRQRRRGPDEDFPTP